GAGGQTRQAECLVGAKSEYPLRRPYLRNHLSDSVSIVDIDQPTQMRQPAGESGGQSPLAGNGCRSCPWPVCGSAKCRHSRLLGSAIGTSSQAGLVFTT